MNIDEERVVFVTADGVPTGETGNKLASHHANTRLHLAFSCYVFRRSDNAFLITRRALSKKVWPGVWTNSVCGHPAPGEPIEDAVRRRADYELGLPKLFDVRCVLPRYTYKSPEFDGVIEHEFCPVFTAVVDDEPAPNPEEVDSFRWVSWAQYVELLGRDDSNMSYWAKDQFQQLKEVDPFVTMPT
ncbi:isopentenyl-diphosphate Delta-isomerase [Lentzea sp. NPDC051213]|uniref:isopentenyl-diphosphate Delta-isomerase n=1 Tax=Lentzea sp. NPDC051213 TaxID=3364126 RepID=UPI00379F27C9